MSEPTKLGQDNDGVVKQSTKTINHTQAAHYRIAQAYIRQLVHNYVMKLFRLKTDYNWTDIYTKALNAPAYLRHQDEVMGTQTHEECAEWSTINALKFIEFSHAQVLNY